MNQISMHYIALFALLCSRTINGSLETINIERLCFDPIQITTNKHQRAVSTRPEPLKPWTIVVYMAADNDMHNFAFANIRQMAQIGSSENANILVHLNIKLSNTTKITRRYYIEKEKITCVSNPSENEPGMDSGDPKTLFSCCKWAIEEYPAQKYALILWNHGTGCLEPYTESRSINTRKALIARNKIEQIQQEKHTPNTVSTVHNLDKTFTNWLHQEHIPKRGVCWDSTTGNHISNNDLARVLKQVNKELLMGKKWSIIGFDTCLMAMAEVACDIKEYAHLMVASQETELGPGWNYAHAFSKLRTGAPTGIEFATSIIHAYEETYKPITREYTLSVINLDQFYLLEENIHQVARIIIEIAQQASSVNILKTFRASASKLFCTHFDEPSFIDLHHLYSNMLGNIKPTHETTNKNTPDSTAQLIESLKNGLAIIEHIVIANVTGKGLSRARGISIYVPEKTLHQTYTQTRFAQSNNWLHLLHLHLRR